MRIFRILPIAVLLLSAAQAVHGQGAGPSRFSTPPSDKKKELSEAAEKLKKAKNNVDLDKAKQAANAAADKLPSRVTDAAKDALQSPETREKVMDAAKSAADTLMPEAQKLLKKEPTAGAPAATSPSPAATGQAAAALGPKPMPLQPIADAAAPVARKTTTVTIESDDAVFDLKAAIFIYTGHVKARHPQFYIECEELEVHMVKEAEAAAAAAEAAKNPPPKKDPILAKGKDKDKDKDKSEPPQDNRIKMAIARGPMVSIEKLTENGDIQQGKCKKAVYQSATGKIVMSDYPQVQRGNMLHIATQPDTEMTFDPNGRLSTSGHTRTVILQGGEEAAASAAQQTQQGGAVSNGNPNAQ